MTMFRGAFTAMVTPFREDDELDVPAIERIVDQQLAGGIDGLVLAGTTGEAPALSVSERQQLVEVVLGRVRGRVPVVLGTGTHSTKHTIEATKLAKKWGADAALVVCPYYNRPSQEGLFQHFRAVAEETGIPIVAYNVPSRTASDLMPETIARLVEIDAIVAVKDATANMARAIETLGLVDPAKPFVLISGDDFTILPFVACGGTGVISVVSNVLPHETAQLVREVANGNPEDARALQKRLNDVSKLLFAEPSPAPVKAGMEALGLCSARPRLPLVPASPELSAKLRRALEAFGSAA